MVGLMGLITLHIKFMQGSLPYSNFATLMCVSSNNFAMIDLLPTKVSNAGVDSLLNIFFGENISFALVDFVHARASYRFYDFCF